MAREQKDLTLDEMLELSRRITYWNETVSGNAYAIGFGCGIEYIFYGCLGDDETIGGLCLNIGGGSSARDKDLWCYWISVNSNGVRLNVNLGYFEEEKPGEEKRLKNLYEIAEAYYERYKRKIEKDSENWERPEKERIKRILLDKARSILSR